jgi:hypothetical protein
MAANKKGKNKKATNSKRTASKKVTASRHAPKKETPKKLIAKRISKKLTSKKLTSKKLTSKKLTSKKLISKKLTSKKLASKKTKGGSSSRKAVGAATPLRRNATGKNSPPQGTAFEPETGRSRSGGQSGDLQGLSDIESADSESVDELLEEGNAFEAEAVAGVEHVEDDETREVHTHEVPEDDVPEEYLDKDE